MSCYHPSVDMWSARDLQREKHSFCQYVGISLGFFDERAAVNTEPAGGGSAGQLELLRIPLY